MSFLDSGMDMNQIGPGGVQLGSGSGALNILANPNNTSSGFGALPTSGPNIGSLAAPVASGVAALLNGGSSLPYSGNLNAIAGAAGAEGGTTYAQGQELINPLITGQLPPGAQAEVQNYLNQQNAATSSRYASLGQTGSTMESDALNQNKQTSLAQTFQIAQQMAQVGTQLNGQALQALQLDSSIYGNMMDAQMKEDSSMSSAIGAFASILGGSGVGSIIKAL
jgi:hypothetical protein